MRRLTVQKPQKPLKRTGARRVGEERDELPARRPEIRADIARTWWPDN